MNNINYKRTELSHFYYHPVFIDYDFAASRPRGGSAHFDLFAGGGLCSLMDELQESGFAFIRKEGMLPENGFFLVDFKKAADDPDYLMKIVRDLNLAHIYLEDSARYPLSEIFADCPDIAVSYVSFQP